MLDLDARYTVADTPGVAWRLKSHVRTPLVDEETGELARDWLGECDEAYEIDTSQVIAVMVGDDREHTIDVADLTAIAESEFCNACGQLGCPWGH